VTQGIHAFSFVRPGTKFRQPSLKTFRKYFYSPIDRSVFPKVAPCFFLSFLAGRIERPLPESTPPFYSSTSSPPPTAARCCLHPCRRLRLPRCSSSRHLGQHLSHRFAAPHAPARPAPCRRRSAAAAPHRLRLLAATAVASPLPQHSISNSSFSSATLATTTVQLVQYRVNKT
jgi:hypothetical protein